MLPLQRPPWRETDKKGNCGGLSLNSCMLLCLAVTWETMIQAPLPATSWSVVTSRTALGSQRLSCESSIEHEIFLRHAIYRKAWGAYTFARLRAYSRSFFPLRHSNITLGRPPSLKAAVLVVAPSTSPVGKGFCQHGMWGVSDVFIQPTNIFRIDNSLSREHQHQCQAHTRPA